MKKLVIFGVFVISMMVMQPVHAEQAFCISTDGPAIFASSYCFKSDMTGTFSMPAIGTQRGFNYQLSEPIPGITLVDTDLGSTSFLIMNGRIYYLSSMRGPDD